MKALLSALLFACLACAPAHGADSQASEIAAVREELAAMRSEMIALNLKLIDMQNMIRDMNGTVLKLRNDALEAQAIAQGAQECSARLTSLQTRRDKLASMGYKPEHPDLKNTILAIHKLEGTCGAGAAPGTPDTMTPQQTPAPGN